MATPLFERFMIDLPHYLKKSGWDNRVEQIERHAPQYETISGITALTIHCTKNADPIDVKNIHDVIKAFLLEKGLKLASSETDFGIKLEFEGIPGKIHISEKWSEPKSATHLI